jgi:hypothetical protein
MYPSMPPRGTHGRIGEPRPRSGRAFCAPMQQGMGQTMVFVLIIVVVMGIVAIPAAASLLDEEDRRVAVRQRAIHTADSDDNLLPRDDA